MEKNKEIIEKSIKILSNIVNVSSGLAHPLDESRAKELFKALHKRSVRLELGEIRNVALRNHWSDRHATALAKLAEKIGNGGRVQIKHHREWGEPTVDRVFLELGLAWTDLQ